MECPPAVVELVGPGRGLVGVMAKTFHPSPLKAPFLKSLVIIPEIMAGAGVGVEMVNAHESAILIAMMLLVEDMKPKSVTELAEATGERRVRK